jgi:hypothetical protein
MSIPDLAVHFRQLKASEQISGEHCLRDPGETLPGASLESDPGTENGHALHHPQMRGRNVFVLRLRSQAVPVGYFAIPVASTGGRYPLHGKATRWPAATTGAA